MASSTNHPNATGEVTRIALDAGAESRDLDALQYHPNGGAWPATMQGYSIPETTRAYGAVLLNADGEEFTDSPGRATPSSQAIFDEVERQGVLTPDGRLAVWLDTTRISAEDAEIFAALHAAALPGRGHRPARSRSTRTPVLHYQNGGLVIDEHASTTLEGLFACGEIAGGTHGRNRMMGNSLLECTVFGELWPRRPRKRAQLTITETDLGGAVADAGRAPLRLALKDIPQGPVDALGSAAERETSITGQRVLQTILKNVSVAEDEKNLARQDTGIAVYYCRVGEHFSLHPARIYAALKAGANERRDRRAPAALEHRAHADAREHGAWASATACRSSTGTSFPTGTVST